MRTALECIPCFARQAWDAVRMITADPVLQERMMREALRTAAECDLTRPAPAAGQRIHRRLRELAGDEDPYRAMKERFNRLALDLLPELSRQVRSAGDPLYFAVRLAIAGNIIDRGVNSELREDDVRRSLAQVQSEPFAGDLARFRSAVASAREILYLTDNAGEIVFDRLLIEQLPLARVVVAVRGAPVINDATLADARMAGLDRMVEVIDNGSDAPGVLLEDCSRPFRERLAHAGLVIAKGQGNFETLSGHPANIAFLLKIKCPVVAAHTGLAMGTQALIQGSASGAGALP